MKSMIEGVRETRKKSMIANLYRYSDLSVDTIAQQVDMDADKVQRIIDDLVKVDALKVLVDQSITHIGKLMTPTVVSVDCSKTARQAAALMAEKEIGSIVVTKKGKPFGIVTHSDIVRWAGLRQNLLDAKLEAVATRPLITIGGDSTVEEAASVMIRNEIHKLPVVDRSNLLGIVTITDLAVFLSPSRRSGLALSVLQAISRRKK